MTSWFEQFASKKESIADHFRPPVWFRPFAEVGSIPGATSVAEDLWSIQGGFYVHARESILQPDGTELCFKRPVVILAFLACSLQAVQWHRHVIKEKPAIVPLEDPPHGFPRFSYAEWKQRFDCFESARYRVGDGSGTYVDRGVAIGPLRVCFQSRRDVASEVPYLFEVCHEFKKT